MNIEQTQLYERIRTFPMSRHGDAFPFAARLARENGWTRATAERVVEEYKKFVLLKKSAEESACPSDQVDQAWHLHLTMTKSYWGDFCPNVLGGPLHHTPSDGTPEDQRRHWEAYARTLRSYRRVFGEEPPADVWPAPHVRFSEAPHPRRIDVNRYLLIPKDIALLGYGIIILALIATQLRECVAGLEAWRHPGGLAALLVTMLAPFAAILMGQFFRRTMRIPGGDPVAAELDLDLYEAAVLADGPDRAIDAAMTRLVGDGLAAADGRKGTFTKAGGLAKPASPLEAALHGLLGKEGIRKEDLLLGAAAPLEQLTSSLRVRGLLASSTRSDLGRIVPMVALLAVSALGVLRACSCESEERAAILAFVVLGLAVGLGPFLTPLHRTLRGERVLERIAGDSRPVYANVERTYGGITPVLASAISVALQGRGALIESDSSRQALEGGIDNLSTGCG